MIIEVSVICSYHKDEGHKLYVRSRKRKSLTITLDMVERGGHGTLLELTKESLRA